MKLPCVVKRPRLCFLPARWSRKLRRDSDFHYLNDYSDLVIITERVDDVALLIGQMVKMGLPEVLDRHIPRHWTQRGIIWGWTAVIWLAYILTEGDHRKVSVETYLKGMHHTLSHLTAQVIEPLDLSDD